MILECYSVSMELFLTLNENSWPLLCVMAGKHSAMSFCRVILKRGAITLSSHFLSFILLVMLRMVKKELLEWHPNYTWYFYMQRTCCEKLLMTGNEPG